jgi:hypothetical protein
MGLNINKEGQNMLALNGTQNPASLYCYTCRTYFIDGYRKYGPVLPHSLIHQKLKPFRTDIVRTFGLVKENRYGMEITNFDKGTNNVTIHSIEHDIILTQDIIFDYITTGKISPVIKLNY